MGFDNSIAKLTEAAKRLNDLAKAVSENIDAVNRTLAEVASPGNHLYPLPLSEESFPTEYGREVVVTFLVFQEINGDRQLGVVRRRIFESRVQGQRQQQGEVAMPLAQADLTIQRTAIAKLPSFLNRVRQDGGYAENMDDIFDDAPTRIVWDVE